MEPQARYQTIEVIAKGEFATVFRARDHELNRDVAIKQIHPEYLQDPAKLERYWQEAQLLASLDHPYILTVYDIVRPRGWLILELMQGSIPQQLKGQPIDLDFLRVTLICTLHALRVLEQNHIVHGDVKPGNLLLDRANRVKLGDFGIARRVSGDDGSLIKGNTKYMAPEVVSDQHGPVGPHSDLYSLGFSAFELMCGPNFELLFPGLDMYGGNRQMAWIMWQSALDRRLPEIPRILEGVPEDLRFVIEKLTEKDPARRYRTADEALADLRIRAQLPGAVPPPSEDEVAQAEAAAQAAKKKKRLMYGALAASMLLTVTMLFIPSSSPPPPPPVVAKDEPLAGDIVDVKLAENRFYIDGPQGKAVIDFNPETDSLLLDDKRAGLDKLQVGDNVTIKYLRAADNSRVQTIAAVRPIGQYTGKLASIDSTQLKITLEADPGMPAPEGPLEVSPNVTVSLNGADKRNATPLTLGALQPGDTAVVQFGMQDGKRRATSIQARRVVTIAGTVAGVDKESLKLSVRLAGEESQAIPQAYALDKSCKLTINGEEKIDGKPITLADLQVGDRLDATHDVHFLTVDVHRQNEHSGEVQGVDVAAGTLSVVLPDKPEEPVEFQVAPNCKILVVGQKKPVTLAFIRPGDQVAISHQSADLTQPRAQSIRVTAKPDKDTWAVLIGQQQYADTRLAPLRTTLADARLLRDTLTANRVPADQVVLEEDATRVEIEQQLPAALAKATPGSRLLVYFAGHAFLDANGKPVLALKDFDSSRMDATGLPLPWLIQQIEASPAHTKVLLLDTSHTGESPLSARQPSAAELALAAKPRPNRPISSSVAVLASTSKGQRAALAASEKNSLFATGAASAFAGEADVNADHRIDPNELLAHLKEKLAGGERPQTPALFQPDATPARMSDEAQKGVRKLLAYVDSDIEAAKLKAETEELKKLAPNQPDFDLAAGLVYLKHGKTSFATQRFEAALTAQPNSVLALQALAWQQLLTKNYKEASAHIVRLFAALPKSEAGPDAFAGSTYEWAGRVATFIDQVVREQEASYAEAIQKAVAARGAAAEKRFNEGKALVVAEKDRRSQEYNAALEAQKNQLKFQSRLLTNYVQFPFKEADAYLKSQLDQ